MAWALVPPIYLFFRQTNSANSLLGGPQTGWILSRPVPDWAPTKLLGLTDAQKAEGANIEDLLEVQARRMVSLIWKFGAGTFGSAKAMSEQGKEVFDQLQTSAKQFEKGDTEEATKGLAKSAMDFLKKAKNPPEEKVEEAEDDMVKKATKDSWWGKTAKKHAGDVKFGQVRDAVAAYVVVKTLLPFRIPLSLFLTPKFARLFNRVFASSRT